MKQTAVEWLYKEMIKKSVNDPSHNVLYILQQAKEMEKEQIEDAYWEGIFNGEFLDGQAYYNENYGQK